jgi:P27 family predicted phage terminase small subunit
MPSRPQPVVLKKLHGNPRKRRIPVEPKGQGVLWAPPDWFDDEQRDRWHYALEHAPPGLLSGTDFEVLATWCIASVEHKRAALTVRKEGQIVETKGGNIIQHPALGIMNRQAMILLRAGGELGFSPGARASLGARAPAFNPLPTGGARSAAGSSLLEYLEDKPDTLQ